MKIFLSFFLIILIAGCDYSDCNDICDTNCGNESKDKYADCVSRCYDDCRNEQNSEGTAAK